MPDYDDWIESHVNLADHPKVHMLARTLSVRYTDAVGTLHLLWWYAMRFAWRDGDLTKYGDDAVEGACKWTGDRGSLVKALQVCGWLDNLIVHDWLDFAGRLVTDRLRYERTNAKRTQSVRKASVKRTPSEANLTLPDLTLPNHNIKDSCAPKNGAPAKKPEAKVKKPTEGPEFWFEKIWRSYPEDGRKRKKDALRYFKRDVKDVETARRVWDALQRYKKSRRVAEGFVQNAPTWFNDWQSYIPEEAADDTQPNRGGEGVPGHRDDAERKNEGADRGGDGLQPAKRILGSLTDKIGAQT